MTQWFVITWAAIAILMACGFGALMWADRRDLDRSTDVPRRRVAIVGSILVVLLGGGWLAWVLVGFIFGIGH